jgi:hypothetical protein
MAFGCGRVCVRQKSYERLLEDSAAGEPIRSGRLALDAPDLPADLAHPLVRRIEIHGVLRPAVPAFMRILKTPVRGLRTPVPPVPLIMFPAHAAGDHAALAALYPALFMVYHCASSLIGVQ